MYLAFDVLGLRCCASSSLVAASGGYSPCGAQASHRHGFSSCGAQAVGTRVSVVVGRGVASVVVGPWL